MSFWKGTSERKLDAAESVLWERAGIPSEDLKTYKVEITPPVVRIEDPTPTGDQYYIYTYELEPKETPPESQPPIVLVHGYGGSGLLFYRILDQLRENHKVYLIDLFGMGRSGRPKWRARDHEEAERFFVDSLESWRENMNLTFWDLAGHSFGGFVVARYALKYQKSGIRKLMLMSPLGVIEKVPDEAIKKEIAAQPFSIKIRLKLMNWVYKKRGISAMSPLRGSGRLLGPVFTKKYINRRMASIPNEDKTPWKNYLYQVLALKGSGEFGINIMFDKIVFAHNPILTDIVQLTELYDVSFFYGTVDWMDLGLGGNAPVSHVMKQWGVKTYMITDSDHHLYFDNMDHTFESMMEELKAERQGIAVPPEEENLEEPEELSVAA